MPPRTLGSVAVLQFMRSEAINYISKKNSRKKLNLAFCRVRSQFSLVVYIAVFTPTVALGAKEKNEMKL